MVKCLHELWLGRLGVILVKGLKEYTCLDL
jgi:hypothetical protein